MKNIKIALVFLTVAIIINSFSILLVNKRINNFRTDIAQVKMRQVELTELTDSLTEGGVLTIEALVETVNGMEAAIEVYDENVDIYNNNWEIQWEWNDRIVKYLSN